MLARTVTHALVGLDARRVDVEAHLQGGIVSAFALVGLADRACQEAKHRVRSGIASAELQWPGGRVTVNLAPAELRKEGSGFDLPIALAILAASRQVPPERVGEHAAVGELGLNGRLRPVGGVLAAAEGARTGGLKKLLCAAECAAEAALAGIEPIPVRHLAEAVAYLRGERDPPTVDVSSNGGSPEPPCPDLMDVRGQERARRALELAAAGSHNLLLAGPPGTGKTMLARRLPGVLPRLPLDEALEVTRIHSVAGLLAPGRPLVTIPPFRAPHHTASVAAIVGGGPGPRPGEASLAHRGVLFLDELAEFPRNALEALRQPLEGSRRAALACSGAAAPVRTRAGASGACRPNRRPPRRSRRGRSRARRRGSLLPLPDGAAAEMNELALAAFAAETGRHLVREPQEGQYERFRAAFNAERYQAALVAQHVRFVSRSEARFPQLLRELYDPPAGLFLRGSAEPRLLSDPSVAVVGARSCSSYGAQVARLLGRELAAAGLVVVSGLARGVDCEAHRGALEVGGATIAVLGCGIHPDYPPAP